MERLTIKTPKGAALNMADEYPTEAAIRADLMRRYRFAVDRLAAYEDTGLMPEEITDLQQAWDMYGGEEGITALLAPPNTPLTLEELREMDGEPVWIECHDGRPNRWAIIETVTKTLLHTYKCGVLVLEEIGKTWFAYRRKPEEGAT